MHMRRLLLASAALALVGSIALFTGTAPAADLKPVYKAKPVAGCGPARFTGGYIGGNVGGIAYSGIRQDQDELLNDNSDYTHTRIGVTAGMQAGWDWQLCNKVFGIVADWSWADADASVSQSVGIPGTIDISTGGKLHWFSTVRARAGLAVDDMLFYVTGGLAIGRIDSTVAGNSVGFVPPVSLSSEHTRLGLAVGAGAEYAFMPHWSINAEVLYLQFERQTDTFGGAAVVAANGSTATFESNDKAWVARVGLNYRWNGTGPVAAAPVPYAAAPGRFGGFYIGGNVGGVSYTAVRTDQNGYLVDNAEYTQTKTGFTGGVQAGFDWQRGTAVLGIVADFNWADTEAKTNLVPNDPPTIDVSTAGRLNWFGTVRGRAGIAVDDVLVYATGGFAYANIDSTYTLRITGVNERFSFSNTRGGLVAGVGAEAIVWGNWSVNSELLYMQFQKNNVSFFSPNAGGVERFENNDSAWVSRVGLNYRFNGGAPAAPSYAPPPARFAGFYLGGHAGALAYTATRTDLDEYFIDAASYTNTDFAGTVGAKAGWDWQWGRKVFGVVADINWTNAEATNVHLPRFLPPGAFDTSEMRWFGTLRTRGGLVVSDTLVYVTGGLAAARIKSTYRLIDPPLTEEFSFSDTRWGWTGGFGAEYKLWSNWSVNAEALFMQFRHETDTFFSPSQARNVSWEANDSAWVTRLGINYRFDPGPVVAKY
jgi:outer membrane immunogenic protein